MLDKVHKHIINELQQSARTDTIFVITAVLFNLIVLGINSAVAGNAVSEHANPSDDFVLFIFIFLIIVVNFITTRALSTGKSTRNQLLHGLIAMYRDNDVDKYYNQELLTNYADRYRAFMAVILCIALTAIIVPLFIRLI